MSGTWLYLDGAVLVALDITDERVRDGTIRILLFLDVAMRTSITRGVEVVVGHGRIIALWHRAEVGTAARASTAFTPDLLVVDPVDVSIGIDSFFASHFETSYL